MGRHTPLYEQHCQSGAKMVDFGGWDMPLHYGSQISEHHAVRQRAGLFDVSHMQTIDVRGPDTRAFLRTILANDVAKLTVPGKALYGCLLNEAGGVLDDLITYYLTEDWFRIVVNAGPADQDYAWFVAHSAGFRVTLRRRPEFAMLAVQGPEAQTRAMAAIGRAAAEVLIGLKPFQGAVVGDRFIARTGYTGEAGFEILVPDHEAVELWRALVAAGIAPAGLGARDTLRLEAGMNLYGHDMDSTTTPWETGLGWTVALTPGRDFIGRKALEAQQTAGVMWQMAGLVLLTPGVLRDGQAVQCAAGSGRITSGSFSPTLERGIALCRFPVPVAIGEICTVEMRPGRIGSARVVSIPFVRQGRVLVDI